MAARRSQQHALAGGGGEHPLGVGDAGGQGGGIAVEGAPVRRVHAAPVDAQQTRLGVGVGQPDGALKGDVPFVVRKIQQNQVGLGHGQVGGQQLGVPRQPDAAVRSVEPVAAVVLFLPMAVGPLLRAVLPVVSGRGQGCRDAACLKGLPDVVAGAGQAQSGDLFGHVPGRMVGAAGVLHVQAARAAEMVVVDVGDEQRVQPGDLPGQDGRLDQQRHIEILQQGVHHQGGAPAVEKDAGAAQPGDGCVGARAEIGAGQGPGGAGHGLAPGTCEKLHRGSS